MVQTLTQGGNVSVAAMAAGATKIAIEVSWSPERIGGNDVDASAFLLNAAGKVRSDADFVFYNQPRSADGSVETKASAGGKQRFTVDLSRTASDVDRIAFVATIHGGSPASGGFGQAKSADVTLLDQSGTPLARFDAGTSGRTEAALILGELYRRAGEWKLRAVGQGFGGGLGPLASSYGVDIGEPAAEAAASPPSAARAATPSAPAPSAPAPASGQAASKVRLEKKMVNLEKKDPQLVNLVKKVQVELEKKDLVTDQAKVALVLDISGSMYGLYNSGKIDHLVERVMALGYRLDDNGEIDVFLFGQDAHEYGTVGLNDYRSFVRDMMRRHNLEAGTNYGRVIRMVRDYYRRQPDFNRVPVYVMFVTDGDTQDRPGTEREIRDASGEGIFWQFMAIGEKKKGWFGLGSDFEFLEKLDEMPGRRVDNADFFLVKDPKEPADEELFRQMMAEYPDWLKAARSAGILQI